MKKRIYFIYILIFILILLIIFLTLKTDKTESKKENAYKETVNNVSENKVSRVIDGDTFVLDSGEIIRLLCVDSPEKGEKGYQEAKIFLENLILNKNIVLEKDISEKDVYNRSLRYVYQENIFLNKELVKNKHAAIFRYGNDTKRCDEIAQP
ncbi:MAG: thermonuclease family protein [Nanoarchaeota archaeon]